MFLPGAGDQFQPFADLEVRLDLINKPLKKTEDQCSSQLLLLMAIWMKLRVLGAY